MAEESSEVSVNRKRSVAEVCCYPRAKTVVDVFQDSDEDDIPLSKRVIVPESTQTDVRTCIRKASEVFI